MCSHGCTPCVGACVQIRQKHEAAAAQGFPIHRADRGARTNQATSHQPQGPPHWDPHQQVRVVCVCVHVCVCVCVCAKVSVLGCVVCCMCVRM
jgi:hypothetical protein